MISTSKKTCFLLAILTISFLLAGCRDDPSPDASGAAGEVAQLATSSPTVEAPAEPVATSTDAPLPTPSPTVEPSPPATVEPSPTATAEPSPTIVPPTPTATATFAPTPAPGPEWLAYLNRIRTMASLPPLREEQVYSEGSALHSTYMVKNDDPIAHDQDVDNEYYEETGAQAARNGNLFASSQLEANHAWSVNFWTSAPFHLVGLIDPYLEAVGYGDYIEDVGDIRMAGVLDLRSYPLMEATTVTYPVIFPGPDTSTWIVRHGMFEWPDPLTSCPNLVRPAGAPIVLLFGPESDPLNVESHQFYQGDVPLDSCRFDQLTYINENEYAQSIGRQILARNNALVIIPQQPLPIDQTYSVQVRVNGQEYNWQFHTQRRAD